MVKIDGINMPDVILSSIQIGCNEDASTASFDLARKHDKVDYTIDGVYYQISNNNAVEISINGIVLFTGNIEDLTCSSSGEKVTVQCKGDRWNINSNIIDLPLTKLNEKIHLYDVLIDDIQIHKGVPDLSDPDETEYRGIKIDLGKRINEVVDIWQLIGGSWVADKLNEGTFQYKPNYTYFWQWVTARLYGFIYTAAKTYGYIGTSLSTLSTDLYDVTSATCKYQRILENVETELGYYYLGTAPYKEVNCRNGQYIAKYRYEDKEDGLYVTEGDSNNFIPYASQVANLEFSKIKSINNDFINASCSIVLTIDAYLYYKIKLYQRINIVNTTQDGIYKNLNGFPVSVKSIVINSSDMTVTLECDNQKSKDELEKIDGSYPNEDNYIYEGYSRKIMPKVSLPTGDEIE